MKNKTLYKIIFLLIITFSFSQTIYAKEATLCEYSDEYLKYLEIPESERENIEVPEICKKTKKEIMFNNISSYSLNGNQLFPSTYSSVDKGYISSVKAQGVTSSCWTFAATSSLEAYLKKIYNEDYDFSERHMEYSTSYEFKDNKINPNGYYRSPKDGGNILMSSSYYLSHKGPVLESEMPFENNTDLINIEKINIKPSKIDINDYSIVKSTDCKSSMNIIKNHIMQYGAMQASFFMTTSNSYFNPETSAFYYNGNSISNHAVTIVGWDDSYSVDNFSSTNKPKASGAWLVKNSYGEEWGDKGYFHVSYEDSVICSMTGGVTDVDKDTTTHLYQHETLGYNTSAGYINSRTGYAAVKYQKGENVEVLREIVIGSPKQVDYEIYLLNENTNKISVKNSTKIAEGTLMYGGYKTVKLSDIYLLPNKEFTIIVKYTSFDEFPIPLLMKDNSVYKVVEPKEGISFISPDGENYTDLLTNFDGEKTMAVVKVGTDDVDYNITPSINFDDYHINNKDGGNITIPVTTKDIPNGKNLEVNVYNGNNLVNGIKITNPVIMNNKTNIVLDIPNNQEITPGDYKIEIKYGIVTKILYFKIYEYKDVVLTKTQLPKYIFTNKTNEMKFYLDTSGIEDNSEINVRISKNGVDQTPFFQIENNIVINNKSTITITTTEDVVEGTHLIEFTLFDKKISTTINIENYIKVNDINVYSQDNNIMYVGKTKTIIPEITPSTASMKGFIYQSSDEKIIKVTEEGKLLAIKKGNAVITIKSEDESCTKEIKIPVKVIDPKITFQEINIYGNAKQNPEKIYSGYGGQVSGIITLNDLNYDTKIKVYNTQGKEITGTVDVNIKELNENKYSFIININNEQKIGNYRIRATSSYKENDQVYTILTEEMFFEVNTPILVKEIKAEDLKIGNSKKTKLNYVIEPSNALNQEVRYETTNKDILDVDENGNITPKKMGTTTIKIISTDGSNVSKTIKVEIIEELFVKTKYETEDEFLKEIEPKTNLNTFINSLNVEDKSKITVYDINGNKMHSGYMCTGCKVVKEENGQTYTYTMVVTGDVSGDGLIRGNDSLLIDRSIIGLTKLSKAQELAADISKDKRIRGNDSLLIDRFLIGLSQIIGG